MFVNHFSFPAIRIRSAGLLAAVGLLGFTVHPIDTIGAPEPVEPPASHSAPQAPTGRAVTPPAPVEPVHRIVPRAPARPEPPLHGPASPSTPATPLTDDGIDPFSMITSPDVGDHCAASLAAEDLTAFFSEPIGAFRGGDYQRALRLADDRVLWTFQDAFLDGTLVHNVAMIQSGRCFTLLNEGRRSWLLADATSHMEQWHWILDGVQEPDGSIHLFVVQMNERGGRYLGRTEPSALRRVVVDQASFDVLAAIDETPTGLDLYGWSVTSDESYTYLYSHCYRQFGFVEPLGFDDCAEYVKLARAPIGSLAGPREYWTGSGWADDHALAQPVIDRSFVGAANNPAQIRFSGDRFLLVEKRDDWWSGFIDFAVADLPQGPFRHVASTVETLKCELWTCNTYFATWVPWKDPSGAFIWSLGHNRWNGAETARHLDVYRPTFQLVVP